MPKILFLACTALLFGCASSKKSSARETPAIEVEDVKIVISKMGCFGRCEQFDMTITQDGKLLMNGKRYVKHIGLFTATLPSDMSFSSLESMFEDLEFTSLKDQYLSVRKDFPLVRMSYLGKSVEFHEPEAPEDLKKLMDHLDKLRMAVSWIKE